MEELRTFQKEQERERRRLRDRQRRQSMSVEEREKHLARRRRNYQLRRQRAENSQLDPHFDSGDMLTTNLDLSVQCITDAAHVGLDGREGLDVPAHKLAEFPGKLRLNHLKRLARSLNGPVGENHRIEADVLIKGNTISNCISPKGVRLNRVKQLARGLNSAVKETVLDKSEESAAGRVSTNE